MHLHVHGRILIAVLGIIAVLGTAAHATEDDPQACPEQVERGDQQLPLLGHIPYVGRLFVDTGKKPCGEKAERIGVDFTIVDGQMIEANGLLGSTNHGQFFSIPEGQTVFSWHAGEACDPRACAVSTIKCGAAGDAKCGAACDCAAKCADKCGATSAAAGKGTTCCGAVKCGTAACCEQLIAKASRGTCPVKAHWEEITDLVAEKAAMEATLEAHEELLEARSEMFETLAETMIEKAKLEARLEMVEHRDAMLKEMVELQAENARLKAQSELAQQKEELLRSQLVTVLENERLKQRVAELEQQRSESEEPVLTSKRAEKLKKSR